VLKATITGILALTTALSIAGCNGKPQEAAKTDATAVAAPAAPAATPQTPVDHPPARPVGEVDLTGIARADGGKTVAEVFAESATLASQKVSVRGKVVKTNAGIMGKDWLHIRDGSGADGTNDLTVTTTTTPLPKIGDTVVISGTVVVDKDFGMGYQYPVMIEDAVVTIEATLQ
jgi:starvation-inducible outer membrane lipoprotein